MMTNPDVAQAIPEMVHSGILEEQKARKLLRIARCELISIQAELRLLFYLGVLLVSAGAGLLIKENYLHIGPVAVALVVGLGAAACFAWVARQAPAFSWGEVPSPSLGYDYLLLLSVLLGAADLAFIEVQFTPLGAKWPWHLLITSVLMGLISVRYDSRTVFSLALSTFAAWRGVSVSIIERPIWHASAEPLRWNAICCGLVFLFLGNFLMRSSRKAHFEPMTAYLGWLLIFGALIAGGAERGANGMAYVVVLFLTGAFVAWHYLQRQRFLIFAAGVLAVFVGFCEVLSKLQIEFMTRSFLASSAAIGLVAFLWKTHRKMKEPIL